MLRPYAALEDYFYGWRVWSLEEISNGLLFLRNWKYWKVSHSSVNIKLVRII